MDLQTLEVCLGTSGTFEGGDGRPRYDLVTGDFDQQGISIGALQWAVGQGSAQKLLQKGLSISGGFPDPAYAPILALATLSPEQGVAYARAHLLTDRRINSLTLPILQRLLLEPAMLAAQRELAGEIGDKAETLAATYTPGWAGNLRSKAYFFDLVVQQGGMSNQRGSVTAIAGTAQATGAAAAIQMAKDHPQTAQAWSEAIQSDELSTWLLHYAYKRARLARPKYVWDALSRRGTLACRAGFVHGVWFDFNPTLP